MLLALTAATAAIWLLWKLMKAFVLSSPLDIIPGPPPGTFLRGNVVELHKRNPWTFFDHVTNDYGQVVKMGGAFRKRALLVFDPKAIHHVVLKDQHAFEESESVLISRRLMFGPGLLSTVGEVHRHQRKLLNPLFSIANLRQMTPLFYETVHRMRDGRVKQMKTTSSSEVDLLDWMGRKALELIGQGGLGHSFDPLVENVPNEYGNALKALLPLSRCLTWRLLFPYYCPLVALQYRLPILNRFIVNNFHRIDHALQETKHIIDTMDATSRRIYSQKLNALNSDDEDMKIRVDEGKDPMSIILRANREAADEDKLPEEEIIAQVSTFTFAGTDTTSNAVSRILHLLCLYPEIQEKMRAEILEAQAANGGEDLEYDNLVDLPYLDAVCRETLRLYPPAPFITRKAYSDTILPFSKPLTCTNGTTISSIPVPKGTTIIIAIYSANRNKAIWGEDADEWEPERWLDGKMPQTVTDAKVPGVYSNLMTFLGGGRACIGFKFSQLEMKVALVTLLSTFRFSLASGENSEIVWNRAGVVYPSVGWTEKKPSMPLKVELLSA